jgi:prefoldin subunit 5
MAKVSEKCISSYLNNKLLEAIKPLNEMRDALHTSEEKLMAEIDSIIERILSIQI